MSDFVQKNIISFPLIDAFDHKNTENLRIKLGQQILFICCCKKFSED